MGRGQQIVEASPHSPDPGSHPARRRASSSQERLRAWSHACLMPSTLEASLTDYSVSERPRAGTVDSPLIRPATIDGHSIDRFAHCGEAATLLGARL